MKISVAIGILAFGTAMWSQAFAQEEVTRTLTDGTLETRWMENGQQVDGPDGVSVMRVKKNARGEVLSVKRTDKAGNPADGEFSGRLNRKFRYSSEDYRYDKEGRLVEAEYKDKTGKPAVSEKEWARAEYAYGDNRFPNKITSEKFFGADGKPTMIQVQMDLPVAHAYHSMTVKYDANGEESGVAYQDIEGKPADGPLGFSTMEGVLDGKDRLVEAKYLNKAGKAATHVLGYSRVKYQHDENGRVTRESFYDAAGKPVEVMQGDDGAKAHAIVQEYDAAGNVTYLQHLDAAGKPVVSPDSGAAATRMEYGADGKLARETFLGANGKPLKSPRFPAVNVYTYGPDGQLQEIRSLDDKGKEFNPDTGMDEEP